ncbi:hypothetical protein N7457_006443 [Penicillium paradoxum]|uniref:uncharacterized protein n=1 Tax=Penicillium paradoxum TaxID=176176 RepID=UPI0025479EFA|nr:uncharacterized protein N7457_006443 [Penicillium paradoxum]KAJ5781283.1 hypothetical protein N7457_006443 [Penicillium paradoxum]
MSTRPQRVVAREAEGHSTENTSPSIRKRKVSRASNPKSHKARRSMAAQSTLDNIDTEGGRAEDGDTMYVDDPAPILDSIIDFVASTVTNLKLLDPAAFTLDLKGFYEYKLILSPIKMPLWQPKWAQPESKPIPDIVEMPKDSNSQEPDLRIEYALTTMSLTLDTKIGCIVM